MAQTRLEKVGTVYTRITSLLRAKGMKEEDKPLWLAVYAAFPPKYEPRYDRQMPTKPVRPIFYKEDVVRAKFHKDQSLLPLTSLTRDDRSATQNFLSIYKTIQKEGLSEDSAYEQARQQYVSELKTRKESTKVIGNYK